MRPPLSAIIPSWNAKRYLPACIQALHANLLPHDEIILVDNGSLDGVSAWAHRFAPTVQLVTLSVNRGFAGGTNAGIRVAKNPLLLLCNDDALLEHGSVSALWNALCEHERIGAAAGVLTFSRHPTIVASAGIQMQRDGIARDGALGQPVTALPTTPQPVFGASGGFALLRRAMLDDIGLFAETFFCYLEDADLAWRARLCGWDSVLAPAARARHVYSASGSHFKQQLLARNRIRMLIRCLPTPLLHDCLPAIVRYDALAMAYAIVQRQPAIAAGRVQALHELPMLLQQRRAIQATATVSASVLAPWLAPAPPPWHALQQQRLIARFTR